MTFKLYTTFDRRYAYVLTIENAKKFCILTIFKYFFKAARSEIKKYFLRRSYISLLKVIGSE